MSSFPSSGSTTYGGSLGSRSSRNGGSISDSEVPGYLGAGLATEYDDNMNLVGYECGTAGINIFETVEVPYYYDVTYSCAIEPEIAMDFVSGALLEQAAKRYRISPEDYEGCEDPAEIEMDNWVFAIRSDPPDVIIEDFGCLELEPETENGECCKVVKGAMEFVPSGGYNETEFKLLVGTLLDSDTITRGSPYTTSFLGAQVPANPEAPRDRIKPTLPDDTPPDVSATQGQQPTSDNSNNKDNKLTVLGSFVTAGLVLAVVGMCIILIRRRRRARVAKSMDVSQALQKSDLEHGGSLETHPTFEEHPTFEVDLTPAESQVNKNNDFNRSGYSDRSFDKSFDIDEDEEDRVPQNISPNVSYPSQGSYEYTFDLGNNFKNEIMGAHGSESGPTSIPVVAPYPMEDTSDSEVDSWAQTEGTVGSLEEHLEEITAEI